MRGRNRAWLVIAVTRVSGCGVAGLQGFGLAARASQAGQPDLSDWPSLEKSRLPAGLSQLRIVRTMETVKVTEVPEDAQIVDVRSQMEWDDGHAAGSIHIPMEEIPSRYGELDLDSDIYLMCRSGGRSTQVATWLEENGIDTIVITGGMIDWEHFGRPIEK